MMNATIQIRTEMEVKGGAMRMYEEGKLSLGQASRLCGMDIYDFTALLAASTIPVINYSTDDFEKELDAIGVR
jgi:predicted HTH domain antitoxin